MLKTFPRLTALQPLSGRLQTRWDLLRAGFRDLARIEAARHTSGHRRTIEHTHADRRVHTSLSQGQTLAAFPRPGCT